MEMKSVGSFLSLLGGACRSLKNVSKCQNRGYLAAVCKEYGHSLLVEEKNEELTPDAQQVIIRVDSSGVNGADLLMIRGKHHLRQTLPFVPGFELAGEVVKVGSQVSRFKPSDRVLGIKRVGSGSFGQYCALFENAVYKIPYSLNYEVAACLPVAYGSAYHALTSIASIKEGDYILVLTSRGSTGLAAIDLALNVFRSQVIAACESEAKCAIVRPMGVLSTVEYTDENLPRNVLKATEGRGADIIIDTVGGEWFDLALKCLKPGGHVCSLSFSSGKIPKVSLQDLIRYRATVSGVWLGGLAQQKAESFQKIIRTIIELYEQEYISPFIAAQYPLIEINEALEAIENSKSDLGKTVLILR